MSCGPKTIRNGGGVWTLPDMTTPVFVPRTGTLRSADYASAGITLELLDPTNQIEVGRGVTTSDDGVTWNTPVAFGTAGYISSAGFDYPGGLDTIPTTYRFLRFGILARNVTSAAIIEQARVNMSIDLDPR